VAPGAIRAASGRPAATSRAASTRSVLSAPSERNNSPGTEPQSRAKIFILCWPLPSRISRRQGRRRRRRQDVMAGQGRLEAVSTPRPPGLHDDSADQVGRKRAFGRQLRPRRGGQRPELGCVPILDQQRFHAGRPCLRAWRAERALPATLAGPRGQARWRRLASGCAVDLVMVSSPCWKRGWVCTPSSTKSSGTTQGARIGSDQESYQIIGLYARILASSTASGLAEMRHHALLWPSSPTCRPQTILDVRNSFPIYSGLDGFLPADSAGSVESPRRQVSSGTTEKSCPMPARPHAAG
jgi:hypothetical protein